MPSIPSPTAGQDAAARAAAADHPVAPRQPKHAAPEDSAPAQPTAPEAPVTAPEAAAAAPSEPTVSEADTTFPGSGYVPVMGRIPILDLRPQIADNLFNARAYENEVVPFSCVAFREGHDRIGVQLVITNPAGETRRMRMQPGRPGLDEWIVSAQLHVTGAHTWHVEAFGDDYATWKHNAEIKVPAGIDVELMLEEGARVLERALDDADALAAEPTARAMLRSAIAKARNTNVTATTRLAELTTAAVQRHLTDYPVRSIVTHSDERILEVQRLRSGFGAWYEFFPRSEGAYPNGDGGSWTSGTFATAAKRLDGVAGMNFDVVYLPPIHPIGVTNRKGPNNTLTAGPNDPGSPWAIGSAEGGHKDVHPDLGTLDDFVAFRERAEELGLEVALDLALQATPDHPWVKNHPEWFTTLADGTIAYAENPPKKYQDIYPLNFDNDRNGLYLEVLETVQFWVKHGVKIFRVDNPHTKPLQFWEWLIHEINAEHPEVIFLAEAFTRPAVMTTLAKAGFQQSYSYFTWRNTRDELHEFMNWISHDTSAYMRPNLFVNTPDILTEYLQHGGRPAYEARAVIGSMAGTNWGVYAGFELIENVARPGSEENIDNEKYEYKQRNWDTEEATGRSLAPLIRRLNEIRHQQPALQQLRNYEAHLADSDQLYAFSKHLPGEYTESGAANTVIVVVNLSTDHAIETMLHLDTTRFGINPGSRYLVEDQLSGSVWEWGDSNYVRLEPGKAHVLRVQH